MSAIDTKVHMPAPAVRERHTRELPGLPMFFAGLVVYAVGVLVLVRGVMEAADSGTDPSAGVMITGVLLLLAASLIMKGLFTVAPGEARVLQFLGRYVGTVRTDGLRWANPFTTREKISTRIRNHETQTLKVNDADGNPIEMAAVVVWQVTDTAKAAYAIEDVLTFVTTQAETAVRHIAGNYPYDARGTDRISLRDSAEEITTQLSEELAQRVAVAGVSIIESRITRLSYAAEIAQAMLRRQQADAIVAARERLVEGAVGMVRTALRQLSAEELVDLDEERKAVMVSNLLVVLCGDQPAQPVVNAGTLYQ